MEEIKQALLKPIKIIESDRDNNVRYYFIYKNQRKQYLKVAVKYLNGEGFVITSFFTNKITGLKI